MLAKFSFRFGAAASALALCAAMLGACASHGDSQVAAVCSQNCGPIEGLRGRLSD